MLLARHEDNVYESSVQLPKRVPDIIKIPSHPRQYPLNHRRWLTLPVNKVIQHFLFQITPHPILEQFPHQNPPIITIKMHAPQFQELQGCISVSETNVGID